MIATAMKILMVLALAANVPVSGSPDAWAQFGLAGVVVFFVLYRDWKREDRFVAAIVNWETKFDRLNGWIRDELTTRLAENTDALEQIESCPLKRDYLNQKGAEDE